VAEGVLVEALATGVADVDDVAFAGAEDGEFEVAGGVVAPLEPEVAEELFAAAVAAEGEGVIVGVLAPVDFAEPAV